MANPPASTFPTGEAFVRYFDDPVNDRDGKLHIRHRTHHPSGRGGLTLDEKDGQVWVCVMSRTRFQAITVTADEARQVRDWLTSWLDNR
jgi:hypothetical protein